jgi:cytochrome c oxidase subunit 1
MSTLHPTLDHAGQADHGGHGHELGFIKKYVFSTDHKIIGIQFLITTILMMMVGGGLALAVRWQLARPWERMPLFGDMVFAAEGGQISPDAYTMLFTMHATVMIFLVIIPVLAGAFGNFLIPLQIGADDMAFPTLNMLSYWFMWPAIFLFGSSFFMYGGGPAAGWTAYPLLSLLREAAPGSGDAQTLWLLGLTFVGVSSMMGSVNACPGYDAVPYAADDLVDVHHGYPAGIRAAGAHGCRFHDAG